MIRRLHIRCDISATDSVYYTLDERKAPALRAELEGRRRAGFEGEWLDPDSLEHLTGIRAKGAIRSRRNAQFQSLRGVSRTDARRNTGRCARLRADACRAGSIGETALLPS